MARKAESPKVIGKPAKPPKPSKCAVKVYDENGKHAGQVTVYLDSETVMASITEALEAAYKRHSR